MPDNISPMLLKTSALSQAYSQKKILEQVDLEIKKGEVLAFCGANGSGKTTLLKVLCGLLKPLKGEIESCKPGLTFNLHLPNMGLYADLTVQENFSLFRKLYGVALKRQEEILHFMALEKFSDFPVKYLSFGQKNRACLGRTFLMDADIFLLDEPLTGLDLESENRLADYLALLPEQGKTLVLTMHHAGRLASLVQRWFMLEQGVLVEQS